MTLILKILFAIHLGIATNFAGHDDPGNPCPYAPCIHRDLRDSDLGVAHKTLPCLTKVFIYNPRTGRSIIAKVIDRGPKIADFDLNIAVTRKLRANGAEPIIWMVVP